MPTGCCSPLLDAPAPKWLPLSELPAHSCSGYSSCSHTIDDPLPEQDKQTLRPTLTLGRFRCLFFVSSWRTSSYSMHCMLRKSVLHFLVFYCKLCYNQISASSITAPWMRWAAILQADFMSISSISLPKTLPRMTACSSPPSSWSR